jgi:protein phosphatase
MPFFELIETTSVNVSDLPEAVRHQLEDGISMADKNEASATVEHYRDQIDADKTRAAEAARVAQSAAGQAQESVEGATAADAVRAAEDNAERAVQQTLEEAQPDEDEQAAEAGE